MRVMPSLPLTRFGVGKRGLVVMMERMSCKRSGCGFGLLGDLCLSEPESPRHAFTANVLLGRVRCKSQPGGRKRD